MTRRESAEQVVERAARLLEVGDREGAVGALLSFLPYSLRHSFVTEGDAASVDLGVMKDLAGHVRIATTDRVYRKGVTSAQIEATERMGAHLSELLDGKQDA